MYNRNFYLSILFTDGCGHLCEGETKRRHKHFYLGCKYQEMRIDLESAGDWSGRNRNSDSGGERERGWEMENYVAIRSEA